VTGRAASLVDRIQQGLQSRAETVAVAESLTGGLLAAALTGPAGSSAVFRGGLVVYAADLKVSVAEVPPELLAEHGPVHEAVALALAQGARRVCAADWGLGTTGAAGPESHGGQPAGTVCAAVAGHDGTGVALTARIMGDRALVRSAAVDLVLDALVHQLEQREAAH
jgi:nicotinamide-nucleotide amidase